MNQPTAYSTSGPAIREAVEQLAAFTGSAADFLSQLLRIQCRLSGAEAGVIMRTAEGGSGEVLALWPTPENDQRPDWIAPAMRSIGAVLESGRSTIAPLYSRTDLYGQTPDLHLVVMPLRSASLTAASAMLVRTSNPAGLVAREDRLALTLCLLDLYEARLALQQRTQALERLQQAGRVVGAINEHERAKAAMLAFCNELATVAGADRVSIGFPRGRSVRVHTISHTEKFVGKMELVVGIEAAMDEALDQDLEVIHPAPVDAVFVNRAAGQFSAKHGPCSVCSLPLRQNGKPVAVVTLERPADKPFVTDDLEILRLACELAGARIVELQARDRWFGARWAAWTRKMLAAAVGPEHTWMKAAAVAVFAAIVFFGFAKGPDYIEAPFLIEASRRRVVPAPFDGYLDVARVEPNDQVTANQTVLAELDRSELEQQLAPLVYEQTQHLQEAATAKRDGKLAEAQIAQAQADRVGAEIGLLRYRLSQARITCPIDGVVLRGELKQMEGAPVSKGDVLFEVAPLDDLRAVLMVPEHRIGALHEGQTGKLATAADPGTYVPFTVERINPMAEVRDNRNVFRVRVKLEERTANLLPGVEGASKVTVGRKHYLWLWTRDLVNWVRLKLWI